MRSTVGIPRKNEPSAIMMSPGGIPIRRAVAPLVRRLQQICLSMITDAVADAELVQLEYALLVFVDDVPGISQQTLSEALGIDRNNVSLIADKLEARGLLKRSVNGADRRARELYITASGQETMAAVVGPGSGGQYQDTGLLERQGERAVSGHAGACRERQQGARPAGWRAAETRLQEDILTERR